ANLLVGNDRGAATLECTLTGPHLVAEHACLIAITGADFEPRVNGDPASMWTGLFLSQGDQLTFGGRRAGARAYVAVAGGISADRWLGSMSTNLMCARGGMHGRALVAGDALPVGELSGPVVAGRNLAAGMRPVYGERTLHVIAGPHFTRLQGESREALFSAGFSVSHDPTRMGYRLEGPRLDAPGEDLPSGAVDARAAQPAARAPPTPVLADPHTAG